MHILISYNNILHRRFSGVFWQFFFLAINGTDRLFLAEIVGRNGFCFAILRHVKQDGDRRRLRGISFWLWTKMLRAEVG